MLTGTRIGFGPVTRGVVGGGLLGGVLAFPTLLHAAQPQKYDTGISSGVGRAAAGFAANLAIPGAMMILGAGAKGVNVRNALFASAAAVPGGWWGFHSLTEAIDPREVVGGEASASGRIKAAPDPRPSI